MPHEGGSGTSPEEARERTWERGGGGGARLRAGMKVQSPAAGGDAGLLATAAHEDRGVNSAWEAFSFPPTAAQYLGALSIKLRPFSALAIS